MALAVSQERRAAREQAVGAARRPRGRSRLPDLSPPWDTRSWEPGTWVPSHLRWRSLIVAPGRRTTGLRAPCIESIPSASTMRADPAGTTSRVLVSDLRYKAVLKIKKPPELAIFDARSKN
eukprot:5206157-Prymnesium_polylepis.2